MADLLARGANDRVVVLDLATSSFVDADFQQWPASRIAAEQGVACEVHTLGAWASGVVGLSEELLVLGRGDLLRFLDEDWSPYELALVDVPAGVTSDQLDELALTVGTSSLDEPVLRQLEGSRFRFSGHDDCYLALESRDPALPALLLRRLLALHAASALLSTGAVALVSVPEPETEVAERLLSESPYWIGTTGSVSETSVTLNLSPLPEPWRIGVQPPPSPRRVASFDPASGVWHF